MNTPIPCPFSVGQRIHELGFTAFYCEWGQGTRLEMDRTRPDAVVTDVTEQGFSYEYVAPVPFGRAAWGQMMTGGICYPNGYQYWVLVEEPRSQP